MDILMEKSQVLKLFLIAALLIITPLLSTSLRSTYLYFILNILIVLLGAEAGLLSFFLHSSTDDRKDKTALHDFGINNNYNAPPSSPDKINVVKRSPSTPSIFFIEGGETEDDRLADNVTINGDDDDGTVEVSGQELYHKAETFIGNFYKQLKMQREDSWKKLHDLYQKAF